MLFDFLQKVNIFLLESAGVIPKNPPFGGGASGRGSSLFSQDIPTFRHNAA
jgi:hypothetical protein